ncbi:MAG: hypothetical protein M3P11_07225 [Actinomycetota bacterium]|nr:hypothetical protein [Actinomycetota bacterium]
MLTKEVVPLTTSRTKMSEAPFVSRGTKFDAHEENATKRPSAEREGHELFALGSALATATLARNVTLVFAAAVVPNEVTPMVKASNVGKRTSFNGTLLATG